MVRARPLATRALLAVALLTLVACGPTTADAPVEEAPPPVDVAQSTGGMCATVEALTDTLGMESQGAFAGHAILSEPRTVACAEPGPDSVECAVTGPTAIRVESEAGGFTNYMLEAGQSGTLTIGPAGPACYLNASTE